MRLLDISNFPQRVKFYEVSDPRKERYAILSHVWDKDPEDQSPQEPTFQKLSSIISAPDPLPDAFPFLKLYRFCEAARKAQYKLVWADMCCIDKTSSAELSEAITSMYYWYQCADVCYAYLKDVSSPGTSFPFRIPREEFRDSKWFKRGWTLQELIAPRSVVFYSRDWRILGSKCGGLTQLIHDITHVDEDVLTFKRLLGSVSVARRMSWAATRSTTRIEDRAYSLMGLFGVQIPVIYGERGYAFIRLQEEILRRIPDPTLFAWGAPISLSTLGLDCVYPQDPEAGSQVGKSLLEVHVRAQKGYRSHAERDASYLFAPSPDAYRYTECWTRQSPDVVGAVDISAQRTNVRGDGPTSVNLVPPNMVDMRGPAIPAMKANAADETYYLIPLGCTTPKGRPVALLLSPGSTPFSENHDYWVIGTHVEGDSYCRIVILPSPREQSLELKKAIHKAPAPYIHLPSSVPMATWNIYDTAESTALRAERGAVGIHLAGWCKVALRQAGFDYKETFAQSADAVYSLAITIVQPKLRDQEFYADNNVRAGVEVFKIEFTSCSHPEDSTVALVGIVELGNPRHPKNNSSSLSRAASGGPTRCYHVHGGVENHIPVEGHGNSVSRWSLRGGVAFRSLRFSAGRAYNNPGAVPTKFDLAIHLRPALSALPSTSKTATIGCILEVECSPEPDPIPVLAVGTDKAGDQKGSSKGSQSSTTGTRSAKK
ncbi:Vegetative incompatibility protein HET-E-1 [Trametes pubescens]|uniref:Vegetative incompatibility protein HET-E-1 n=1 Tax=Trametes pubescens TaxID=154538 RepID=A0A1M2V7X0_TRAPU|nr:Vegetative incompatibility protein HET-E-1 [Trametes pubescens]